VSALATHELTKDYAVGFWRKRPYRALDRLTLSVEPGEVFGFLGPNGAGKTTTLKLLMQLVFPTGGRAEILGRPLGDLDVKRRIGYLPENPYFYDYLTAEELRLVRHERQARLGAHWFDAQIVTRDRDPPFARPDDARQTTERRRLAGAVGAHESQDLRRAHREREVFNGDEVAVQLRQPGDLDHSVTRRPSPRSDRRASPRRRRR